VIHPSEVEPIISDPRELGTHCQDCKHGPSGACGVKERMLGYWERPPITSTVQQRVVATSFSLEYHRLRKLGPANDQATACQAAVFAFEAADAVELVR
jgi:hypothetical protein